MGAPPKDNSFADGFLSSLSMILVSEIGDKTFFIACLMAMRHPKLVVYIGALSALAAMTVLSALMGVIVPNVLSVRRTRVIACALFFWFGLKILYDELCKRKGEDDESDDEMAEAAAALRKKDGADGEETGSAAGASSTYKNPSAKRCRSILTPVLVEAFTLTFVAEWGDRSQLATIALAAAKNPYAVTQGGIIGHAICTGAAVIGGNLIAQKVSMRTVNILGGVLFLLFGALTVLELSYESKESTSTAAPSKP